MDRITQLTQELAEVEARKAGIEAEMRFLRHSSGNTQRRGRQCYPPEDSDEDDEEHVPAYVIKPEKQTGPASSTQKSTAPTHAGAAKLRQKRKLNESDEDDEEQVPPRVIKPEKQGNPVSSTHPTRTPTHTSKSRPKRKRQSSISSVAESLDNTSLDDLKPSTPPSNKITESKATPSRKKSRRSVPTAFKAQPKTPLPSPQWTRTSEQKSQEASPSKFKFPAGGKKLESDAWLADDYEQTPSGGQKETSPAAIKADNDSKSSNGKTNPKRKTKPASPQQTPTQKQTYAEIRPFKFKFITSYDNAAKTSFDVYDSSELTDWLADFWSRLKPQLDEWENLAGADWPWELQKSRSSRKRFCVASKLARKPTRWREGDDGFFACQDCAGVGRACFTWVVGGEDGDEMEDDDDGFGAPKGEFWCLPVHVDDRRAEVREGKEMWIWVNEGEGASGSEGEAESGDEGVRWDEYVPPAGLDERGESGSEEGSESNESESNGKNK